MAMDGIHRKSSIPVPAHNPASKRNPTKPAEQKKGKSGRRGVSSAEKRTTVNKTPTAKQENRRPQQPVAKKQVKTITFDKSQTLANLSKTRTIGKAMSEFRTAWKEPSLSQEDRKEILSNWKQQIRTLALPFLFRTLGMEKNIKGKQVMTVSPADLKKYHQALSNLLKKEAIGKKGKSDNMPIDVMRDSRRLKPIGLNLQANNKAENTTAKKTSKAATVYNMVSTLQDKAKSNVHERCPYFVLKEFCNLLKTKLEENSTAQNASVDIQLGTIEECIAVAAQPVTDQEIQEIHESMAGSVIALPADCPIKDQPEAPDTIPDEDQPDSPPDEPSITNTAMVVERQDSAYSTASELSDTEEAASLPTTALHKQLHIDIDQIARKTVSVDKIIQERSKDLSRPHQMTLQYYMDAVHSTVHKWKENTDKLQQLMDIIRINVFSCAKQVLENHDYPGQMDARAKALAKDVIHEMEHAGVGWFGYQDYSRHDASEAKRFRQEDYQTYMDIAKSTLKEVRVAKKGR
ncbi:hypothetical protein CI610_01476 [invertebrate metagenome]|uniref:Uncharacterized protein n=1 Tax=invertebrate metagenome TaxID=1711999 RepID=A0A2H9T8G6_9ZZZZ